MSSIKITFHGDLTDFLPKGNDSLIEFSFNQKISVKHIIESLGIPHPEIGRIENNGRLIGLSYTVQDRDDIQVHPHYPPEWSFDGAPPKFILDNHLGKLTDYMRLLGFDAVYTNDWPDHIIARYAHEENRILLTRDRGLLKRKIVTSGRCVRASKSLDQLAEVVSYFGLQPFITPFQRCPRCNGKLTPVDKQEIIDQLLPLTRKHYHEFTRCESCGQIYWKGSHYDHMLKMLAPYTGNLTEES